MAMTAQMSEAQAVEALALVKAVEQKQVEALEQTRRLKRSLAARLIFARHPGITEHRFQKLLRELEQ